MTPSALADATSTARGVMPAADKAKLDALPANAALEARFDAIETDVTDAETAIGVLAEASHPAVTLAGGNPAGWLSLATQVLTLALVSASNSVAGVVDLAAQTFAGVKTFAAKIIAAAGIEIFAVADPSVRIGTANDSSSSIAFYSTANAAFSSFASRTFVYSRNTMFCLESSTGVIKAGGNQGLGPADTHFEISGAGSFRGVNGSGASDVAVKTGTTMVDGSVNTGATLLRASTGLGGTEVGRFHVLKGGQATGCVIGAPGVVGFISLSNAAGLVLTWSNTNLVIDGNNITASGAAGLVLRVGGATGAISMRGTNDSATVGAATVSKPTGISTIAAGATTCRITNTLIPDPATTKVCIQVTPHGNIGDWWVVQGNGYFDFTLAVAAPGNTSFSWQVTTIL